LSFEVMSSAKTSADQSNRFPFGVANLVSSLKPDAVTGKLNRKVFLPLIAMLFCVSILAPRSSAMSLQHTSIQEVTVAGVVQDQNGAPVTGAEVTITAPSFSARSKTDSAGQFHFDRVPRTLVELAITVQGFSTVERRLNANGEDTTKLLIILAPATISEQVTVTATRTETRFSETAASVVVLRSEDLQTTAAITLDDALRQVPGFNLFRRSSSRAANPTSQGVSLRGLGASGASRALVLADGIPLNDPFGGWIYWDRVPRESVTQVEVLSGAASHLYGSSALGGIISISTRKPQTNALNFETFYGNEQTPGASLFLTGKKRDWRASLATEIFSTEGYIPVAPLERGPIDTPASSRHSVITARLERWFGKNQRVFGSSSFFGESRKNGTPLQTNRTHIRQFSFGGELASVEDGDFTAHVYGGTQVYDQNFSAISANRDSETLTRVQRVPAQFVGFSSQWSRAFGKHQTIVAGYESQQVRGASDEIVFVSGRATSFVGAGGRQQTYGGYFEDLMKFGSRLFINAGARFDYWRNNHALSAARPVTATGPTSVAIFPDHTESALSPHLSAVYRIGSRISLSASGMRAFRAPTLNELYRSFRVGNVLTLANENLRAERLTGGEGGIRFNSANDKLVLRGTFFWNEITRPVANVTLVTTPGLITRQRQNLGRTRSRGVEFETESRVSQYWRLSAGYLFVDSVVVRFPANITLEGLMVPQVARHQFTFQSKFTKPAIGTLSFQGRTASSQFDDDQNLFRLGSYFTVDAFVSRRIARGLEAFIAAENLFNQRYEVGKTPVTTLGPPILVRVGLRVQLGMK
jgi:outer membrane receptor protein involved in Fe transport